VPVKKPNPMGRFKKGQSGNPKGRPKGSAVAQSGSAMDIIVNRTMTIRKAGEPQEVSVQEALQHQTYRKAIDGDKPSRREVLKMIRIREAYLYKQDQPTKLQAPTRRMEPTDPDNANEAMLILGIASIDEAALEMDDHKPPLKLEPWAVQAALGRRRGGSKLTEKEIREIKRCTRDQDIIRWPRGTDQ
jgi:hypothetical protein